MHTRFTKTRSILNKIHRHFSKIAPKYENLRTTDLEPIVFITNKLHHLPKIHIAKVGCGNGRYAVEFFRHLGNKCHIHCIDKNHSMLRHMEEQFRQYNIKNFQVIKSGAEKIPLGTDSIDSVVTFNAVHHFHLTKFLMEATRILKDNAQLFVYTRLRTQNARNIWGRYFPMFHEKETRLYELDELEEAIEKTPNLKLNSVQVFEYQRVSNLERLVEQARHKHYSTFSLYTKKEFEESLHKFKENILKNFEDPDSISWKDENVLLVIDNLQGVPFRNKV